MAAVHEDLPEAQIPADRDLYCGRWDGKATTMTDIIDCRKVAKVTTESLCFFRFWSVAREPASGADGSERAATPATPPAGSTEQPRPAQ